MNVNTRRKFIKDLGFVSAMVLFFETGCIEDIQDSFNDRPMRMKLPNSDTDPSSKVFQDIEVFKDAISQMNALPSTDARSYSAQAGIHGTSSGFTFCHSTQWNSSGQYFLPWHRAYLDQFEKICRELTGEETFALPYWNWTLDKVIPSAFTEPSPNPLYSNRANTSILSQPQAFTHTRLDQIFQGNYSGFYSNLEGDPHNTAHWVIGGVMGNANSPLDPLFWCHHCMVDYCWYDWQVVRGNLNPQDQSWLMQSWNHFVDPDGNPNTYSVQGTILLPVTAYQYEETQITTASNLIALSDRPRIQSKQHLDSIKTEILKGAKINFNVGERIPISEKPVIDSSSLVQASSIKMSSIENILPNNSVKNRIYLKSSFSEVPDHNNFYVEVKVSPKSMNIKEMESAGGFSFFGTRTENFTKEKFYTDITDKIAELKNTGRINSTDDLQFDLEIKSNNNRDYNDLLKSAKLELVIADPTVERRKSRLF